MRTITKVTISGGKELHIENFMENEQEVITMAKMLRFSYIEGKRVLKVSVYDCAKKKSIF